MTFPSNGTPFGASPIIIFALLMVMAIVLFALIFGAYLIFSGSNEQNREDTGEGTGVPEHKG